MLTRAFAEKSNLPGVEQFALTEKTQQLGIADQDLVRSIVAKAVVQRIDQIEGGMAATQIEQGLAFSGAGHGYRLTLQM